jgi:tetratricopeptide (TPR) repeat protein
LCKKALQWLQGITGAMDEKKMELRIRKVLLSARMATEGYGASSVGDELNKIQQVCVALNDKEQLFSTICIKVNHELCRDDWRAATQSTLYFYEEAMKQEQSKWIISSSIMLGQQYFLNAKFKEAASLLEKAIEIYDPQIHRALTYEFGIDQGILASSVLCSLYYFLDQPDKILQLEKQAFTWANELDHKHTNASLYYGLCCLYFYKGDKAGVKKYYTLLSQGSNESAPDMFTFMGNTLALWADGDLLNLKQAVARQEAMGMAPMRSFWYTIIASLEVESGNFAEAKERIQQAISFIGHSDGYLYESELHYLYGLCYLRLNQNEEGLEQLQKAKTIALKQDSIAVVTKVDKALHNLSVSRAF